MGDKLRVQFQSKSRAAGGRQISLMGCQLDVTDDSHEFGAVQVYTTPRRTSGVPHTREPMGRQQLHGQAAGQK